VPVFLVTENHTAHLRKHDGGRDDRLVEPPDSPSDLVGGDFDQVDLTETAVEACVDSGEESSKDKQFEGIDCLGETEDCEGRYHDQVVQQEAVLAAASVREVAGEAAAEDAAHGEHGHGGRPYCHHIVCGRHRPTHYSFCFQALDPLLENLNNDFLETAFG
jgi:hypothetical protein